MAQKRGLGVIIFAVLVVLCAISGIVSSVNSYSKSNLEKRTSKIDDKSFLSAIKPNINDFFMGSDSATIDVTLFGAFSCYHCADFIKNSVIPMRKEYIDTGKVRFAYKSVVGDKMSLMASKMFKCKPASVEEKFKLLQLIYSTQESWITQTEEKSQTALTKILSSTGISSGSLTKCLMNEDLEKNIFSEQSFYIKNLNITTTPVIIVGKTKIRGYIDYENVKRIIDEEIAEVLNNEKTLANKS